MKRLRSLLSAGVVVLGLPAASAQAGCWPSLAFLAPAPVYIYPACNVSYGVVWYSALPACQPVPPAPEEKPAAPKPEEKPTAPKPAQTK